MPVCIYRTWQKQTRVHKRLQRTLTIPNKHWHGHHNDTFLLLWELRPLWKSSHTNWLLQKMCAMRQKSPFLRRFPPSLLAIFRLDWKDSKISRFHSMSFHLHQMYFHYCSAQPHPFFSFMFRHLSNVKCGQKCFWKRFQLFRLVPTRPGRRSNIYN